MKIASYGQAAMHALQPMQMICQSRRCHPPFEHAVVGKRSRTGHARTGSASNLMGAAHLRKDADIHVFTYVRVTESGTTFSDLQAVCRQGLTMPFYFPLNG